MALPMNIKSHGREEKERRRRRSVKLSIDWSIGDK